MGGIGTLATAVLKLSVDGAGLSAGLAKAESDAKARVAAIGQVMDGVRNMAAIAFVAAAASVGSFTKEARDSEMQLQRFKSTMTMLGPEFESRIGEAERWAEKLAEVSAFDDDQLLDSLGRVAQVTGSVSDGMLAVRAATDLARLKGIEYEAAMNMVIMAYNGQERGLKKYIGTLGEGVKGHEALLEIQKRVGGGAESMAGTIGMAEAQMRREWDETKEKLGNDLIPTMTKLYDMLGNIAGALQGVNGNVFLATAALTGLTTVGLTVTKFFLEFNLALKATQVATAGVNAQGLALTGWLRGLPGIIALAVAAIGTLIAAQKALSEATGFDAQDTPGGGKLEPNSGYVAVGRDAQGNKVYEQAGAGSKSQGMAKDIADGLAATLGLGGLAGIVGLNALAGRDARGAERNRAANQEQAEDYINRRQMTNGTMMPPTAGSQAAQVRQQIKFAY